MLELVQVDAGRCDPLGQAGRETHPKRLEEAPAEDEFSLLHRLGLDGAHDHRVARSSCRSHVETRSDLPQIPTECSTEEHWNRPGVEIALYRSYVPTSSATASTWPSSARSSSLFPAPAGRSSSASIACRRKK